MSETPPQRGKSSSSLARPFLRTLDRMQERAHSEPAQLAARAQERLDELFGPSASLASAAFAQAPLGLMSVHTHFFNGFALLLPLPLGVAVAVRPVDGASRYGFEGSPELYSVADPPAPDAPVRVRLLRELLRTLPAGGAVEAAVVWSIPESCTDSFVGALAVALADALALPQDNSLQREETVLLNQAIARALDRPFSLAYALAARYGEQGRFALVDVETRELLSFSGSSRELFGWGCVTAPWIPPEPRDTMADRAATASRMLALLRKKGFPGIRSYRELEHRDLQKALDIVPARQRPLVRFLVSENRRVQKMVAAIQRKDWQLFGALLLMSHAARRDELGVTSPEADLAVDAAERMTMDGIFGAAQMGSPGCVFIAGQPFVVPACLDRIQAEARNRLGGELVTLLV